MAPPPNSKLQSMLQAAVQSVQWTYSIFWQLCPQQGILRWGEGYYNGAIKTRKTVEAMEISTEEACVQRSQQLRELHELLSAEETNPQTRRPFAALEDLTEPEWFYLLCVSFSFHPGVGLPGAAYAKRQHLWLTGANEVDRNIFSRAILAKSAHIQTVVCIPVLEGVVEFGTTDKVQEDLNFIEHVKSFFIDHHPPTPKPVPSENSDSNSTPSYPANAISSANIPNHDDDKEEGKIDSQAQAVRNCFSLMELDTLEDFRVGSPGYGSTHMWGPVEEPMAQGSEGLELLQLQQPASVLVPSEDLAQGDAHYSQTVSTILQNKSRWLPEPPSIRHLTGSFRSAFTEWTTGVDNHHHTAVDVVTSQWLLKCILFTIPYLHAANNSLQGKGMPRHEATDGHVLAERRRREKLNERFLILRSLVPFVTKTDKASILGDTIEYVKHLKQKMKNLEECNRQMEMDQRWIMTKNKKKRVREVEVEVSIIESDALLEVECMHREGLLLDVMKMLRELGVEVMVVQSSVKDDGVFVAELRAKVRENANAKKASIVQVKKALNLIIPPHHHHNPCSVAANGSRVCMDLGCMQHFHDLTETSRGDNADNAMSVNS